MAQAPQVFKSGTQVIAGLKAQDPVKIGSALSQLRQLCSVKPFPAVVIDYLQLEPAADSIFQILNVAREANSIHLLANSLYTLSYLISRSPTSPFDTRHAVDGSRIINHLIQNHSKSIHRCFAPGRTEATLACLTLLISCVCWNEGACAKIVIGELRWDHKTVTRLLQTRQTVTAPEGTTLPNQKGNRSAPKSSKLKGQLHKADIRTLMLRFIFSIVSSTELRASSKQELWKTKGLAEGVLKGLQVDPYETVAFVLGNLWEDVTRRHTRNAANYNHNAFIHHSGWEIFDQNAITMLVQLLERDDSLKDIQNTKLDSTETVAQMAERFLTNLTVFLAKSMPTSVFQHQSNSRLPPYRILLNLVKCLSPTKSMRRWRLALHILESVPSLCFSLWRTASPAIEPSSSLAWISSVGFATKVASIPFGLSLGPNTHSLIPDNMNSLTSLAKNLLAQCIPTPLNRAWFTKTLQYPDALVSFSSLALLLTGLKKARKISDQLEVVIRSTAVDHSAGTSTLWSKLLLAFQQSLQAVLPDSQVLIAILQTSSRRANESKSASVGPPEHSTDESQPNTATRTQKENDTDGDIVAFGALAVLLLYHQLIPQTMRNLNFDHTKLIPTFFKLNLNDELDESQSSSLLTLHRLQSPIAYLCQSRTLPLIGHSASTNPTQPSPALVKVLLLLSSFPLSEKAADSDLAHTPVLIRDIAQETLQAICKSIVPHLRDESEYQELCIWLSALSELRRVGDCVTPLVIFLEDCIRACLRQPLKYLQISEERRNHSTEPMIGARPPTLISALLAKVNAITKGSSTSSTNPSRVALISLVIKFLNLYLFMVLSTSHQTRPITMVHDISSQLSQAFSVTMSNQADAPSTYPDYLGDAIMNILRSATQLLNSATESCHKAISWPSYITQSIFSDQVSALDLMHQSFSFTNKKPKPSKTKKAVAFMDLDSTTTSATFIENGIQSRHHQMEFLRFITRAVEVDMFGIGAFNSEGASANIEQLDYETKASNIKVLVGIISKSFSNDPAVIECFLEEMWHIAQLLVEKRDFELLMDILRAACTGLDKTKAESIKVLTRYSDLISDSALPSLKSKIKKGKSTAKDNALIQCSCYLFPLLDARHQSKLLVALLSSVNPELLGDANCASSITKLVNLTSGLPPQEKQWHLDQLSIDPVIRTLCVLSNTTSSKVATEMLLEIIEQSSDTSRNSDELAEAWSMYSLEVFGSCSTEHSDFGTKLRITSYLARKNKKITLAAITWLSQTPIDQLKLAWDGTLSLLVACLENQTKDDARYDACLLPLGKRRLDELIITIGSCLFSGNDQTPPSVLPNGKETRLLACKALKLIYSSTESLVEQLLADQMTQSGVIPAYSESLDVLSSFRSNHLDAYIDRCLSWLVRRFAEDETCTEDTIRLVESLHAIVARKPAEYALSTHLVNPVLTAALDRLIDSGCVMKLMDLFIRHTKLGEADALKHVRATVESRNFRSLMKSSHQDQGEQDALVLSVINQLVISYPIVATHASLSKTLIPFYGGTLSVKDRLIFQVFHIEDLWSQTSEIADVMLAWKPIIGNRVTTNKPLDVVALLDSEKVEATSVWVLSRRGSDRLPSLPEYYDPSFLLALFLRLIQQGEPMVISTWQSIARAGLLGLAMCALSSDMAAWRFLGDRCLAKSSEKLKALEHMDASEILLPMEHFRYLHVTSEETGKIAHVPHVITLFLSRCLSVFCTAPGSALHQPLSRFLLQRPVIDAKDVPMLYSLLYSSADAPSEGHIWLMQMLHDGLCTTIDWKIMNHRQTFEIFITLTQSSSHRIAPKLRHLLLKLLRKAVSHNQACVKLISKPGLLKVLEQFKPSSKREWKEVMNILQEVASRMPLFHKAIARETVENVIQLLSHFSQTEYCSNSSLVVKTLVILRSLLICSSSWIVENSHQMILYRSETRLIQLRFNHLSQSLSLPKVAQPSSDTHNRLANEIRARVSYLLQL
ncbi:hypothetical protein Pst134EA_024543 [Puccinia striiformis f. sp. tritici]|uniref:hypothetical protein n=1 Tax=Puccinia striiformis f. sp. tritici TaxID=168172 RepID=UPI0020074D36|nr:hypothetical protein Pst134EA_024543 [Puccinia striiformis f. sp. tritici]KAH9453674.1 hypothetical protein Pst134EA_024543 [Puccinia striiformis f. sp. tritici]